MRTFPIHREYTPVLRNLGLVFCCVALACSTGAETASRQSSARRFRGAVGLQLTVCAINLKKMSPGAWHRCVLLASRTSSWPALTHCPEKFKEQLDTHQLKAVSAHFRMNSFATAQVVLHRGGIAAFCCADRAESSISRKAGILSTLGRLFLPSPRLPGASLECGGLAPLCYRSSEIR